MNVDVSFEGSDHKIKKVVVKKLRKVWGYAWHDTGVIEIDPRCVGRKHLEILIHEGSHITMPYLNEEAIRDHAAEITRLLWNQGYRRLDNDASIPLQDED